LWPIWGSIEAGSVEARSSEAGSRAGRLRGLYVGGTLCGEAGVIAAGALGPDDYEMVDFGADDLTVGRAHPMIDPTLRLGALADAVADPATAVLLLDVVLGHGAQDDPAADLAPAIGAAHRAGVPVVVACVGTTGDPQDLGTQAETLAAAGAQVFASNAAAARHAVSLRPGGAR
jgi:FdrA protein